MYTDARISVLPPPFNNPHSKKRVKKCVRSCIITNDKARGVGIVNALDLMFYVMNQAAEFLLRSLETSAAIDRITCL